MVIKIIKKTRKFWLIVERDWIINHFGRNPKKGGIPPKERKFTIKINFIK